MKNYTQIPNHIIEDDRLTVGALRLLMYVMSRETMDKWTFRRKDIMTKLSMTERQYTYARNELIELGYLKDDTPSTTKITFYVNPDVYEGQLDTPRVVSEEQLDTPDVSKLATPRVSLSNTYTTNTKPIENLTVNPTVKSLTTSFQPHTQDKEEDSNREDDFKVIDEEDDDISDLWDKEVKSLSQQVYELFYEKSNGDKLDLSFLSSDQLSFCLNDGGYDVESKFVRKLF